MKTKDRTGRAFRKHIRSGFYCSAIKNDLIRARLALWATTAHAIKNSRRLFLCLFYKFFFTVGAGDHNLPFTAWHAQPRPAAGAFEKAVCLPFAQRCGKRAEKGRHFAPEALKNAFSRLRFSLFFEKMRQTHTASSSVESSDKSGRRKTAEQNCTAMLTIRIKKVS